MSSKDGPSGSGDKTIIRPASGRSPKPGPAKPVSMSPEPVPAEDRGATVFDPGAAQSPPPGWSSGTVIYQGAPFENAVAGDSSYPQQANPPVPATRKVPQDALLKAQEAIEYSSANPIIAAAAPVLILLGHLRLQVAETDAASLAKHLGDAIQEFEKKVADAGVPAEDARIAKFALCETVDDVAGNLPGFDKDGWKQHGMLSRFFQAAHPGVGFFKALEQGPGRS